MDLNITTFLPLTSCVFINFPEGGSECSDAIDVNRTCITCALFVGKFVSGEHMDDYSGISHIVSILIWILTTIIGSFGAIGNLLIILILYRQKSGKPFDSFLTGLAFFDLICCIFSVIAASTVVSFFQGWTRGGGTLEAFRIAIYTCLLSRSGSSFMTVVIAMERFFVVTFPIKCGGWISLRRARILICCISVFSICMGIPRYTATYVAENTSWKHIPATKDLDHLILATPLNYFWYVTMGGFFDKIDFWVPLPLLLLFNGLVFYKIRELTARREKLNMKHKKEIHAARMFLPVIFILLACNIVPIIHLLYITFGIIYRELDLGMLLSFTVNSAVNLPIYYLRGSSFRRETKALFAAFFPNIASQFYSVSENTNSTPAGSKDDSNLNRDQKV